MKIRIWIYVTIFILYGGLLFINLIDINFKKIFTIFIITSFKTLIYGSAINFLLNVFSYRKKG